MKPCVLKILVCNSDLVKLVIMPVTQLNFPGQLERAKDGVKLPQSWTTSAEGVQQMFVYLNVHFFGGISCQLLKKTM